MAIQRVVLFLGTLMLFVAPVVLADSPKSIDQPDSHSVPVKGKVTLYRVQTEGMKLGEGKNLTDAELFVSLDTNPKMVYSLQLKSGSPVSNSVMAATLRDAYVNKLPVTIYSQINVNKDNYRKILMIQLD
ncbi:MAG: hypothetical protein RRB22_11780 [Gammaproteobacteria bacterium]|nr:hypothetical protein [Gammaproteobacteria bacterium]